MYTHTMTSGNQAEIRDAWDELAPGMDEYVTPIIFPLAEDALRLVGLQSDMRFLDVAAGSGGLSIPAARIGADVLATDISPALLEKLETRARGEELSNLETRVMDGNDLELADDTFDIAGSSNGVSIFPNLEQGLRELVRVTKPGGQVLIVTFGPAEEMEWLGLFGRAMQAAVPGFDGGDAPSPAFQLADPEQLRRKLEEVRLNDVRVETITWNFEVQSGAQFWNVMSHANPKAAAMLADLSEEQRAEFEQAVDGIVRERPGDGPAVLAGPIHVGIGTK